MSKIELGRQNIGMESDADEILTYECEFIPGLLQTIDYAGAVRRAFWPELNEEDGGGSPSHRLQALRSQPVRTQR